MTCRNFGIDQAEQQSPQHRDQGNQQQQDKREDRLFLHHLYRGMACSGSWVTVKTCVRWLPTPTEDRVHSIRCRRQVVLQNHFTHLIQDTVMACPVSQIQTNRQLWFFKILVPVCRHTANLFHSRSPFHCA